MVESTALTPHTMYSHMRQRLPVLARSIDEWLPSLMKLHFSADSGSRFWLERKARLGFDPLTDITSVESLRRFGPFDKSVLRTVAVSDLVPRALSGRPRRIFETGGTTGPPCRVVDITTGAANLVMYRTMLEARGLGGLDMVGMTPSGPHAYGHFVARVADSWHGNAHFIDFDPRWVKHLVKHGLDSDPYVDHLVEQTRVLLESQSPGLLFSTSRLVAELSLRLPEPLANYGVRAVCTGGTSLSAEEVRYLDEGFLRGVTWIDTYGNTLMGHALQGDAIGTERPRSYHLPPPLGSIRVVDPRDPDRLVDYGERGRVMISMLAEDLFLPNLLERDSAIRTEPHPWFPWDGVREVQAFASADEPITEGVY